MEQILKLLPQENNTQKIPDLLIEMQSSGLDKDTVVYLSYNLSQLDPAGINNPEKRRSWSVMLQTGSLQF